MKYIFVKGLNKEQLGNTVEGVLSGTAGGHFTVYATDDPLQMASTTRLKGLLQIYTGIDVADQGILLPSTTMS